MSFLFIYLSYLFVGGGVPCWSFLWDLFLFLPLPCHLLIIIIYYLGVFFSSCCRLPASPTCFHYLTYYLLRSPPTLCYFILAGLSRTSCSCLVYLSHFFMLTYSPFLPRFALEWDENHNMFSYRCLPVTWFLSSTGLGIIRMDG
ncbi:hypothetical protein B0T24DRAFT_634924 [Lasiosphaeria ovina]|uniref:Uncharacterized protein n=1 Tax=Lasiosphaeria ovina TaxID=92902 RepID=A0AAE0N1U0_9PEZI|nr:hypothetical protein B0T24DRAFT_634924 [Lasiosphaeria ovina]